MKYIQQNTNNYEFSNFAHAQTYPGITFVEDEVVFIKGKTSVSDGLGGNFYYDENYSGGDTDDAVQLDVGGLLRLIDGTSDAGNIKYTYPGGVERDLDDRLEERVSVKDFGAVGDGVSDDTTGWQDAINSAASTKRIIYVPNGTYLITDTLSLPVGTKIQGEAGVQYTNGFGIQPLGTTVKFQPSSEKDLFDFDGTLIGGFRFHYMVEGLYIEGQNSDARYAFNVNSVIYSRFENIGVDGFKGTALNTSTINNRWVNVYFNGSERALKYTGSNETTDVYEQCSLWGSPVGVEFDGSSIGIRFSNCLFEQLDTYCADIARECQNIQFYGCYGEDVPFDATSTNAVFRVGHTGTTLVGANQLIVVGGSYAGRSAGTIGSFIDCDYTNGVLITSVSISRFTNGFLTTANTRDDSIIVNGMIPQGVVNRFDDLSKVCGVYPHSNLEDVGAESRVRAPVILLDELRQDSTIGIKLGITGDKVSLFGVTPVVQPSTTGETVGFVAGGGTTATSASTATGNIGSSAYRHSDIVKALKQVGILAL